MEEQSTHPPEVHLHPPSLEPWERGAKEPIAVLMSGGVDSSVTAHLLKQAGWDVVGFTMNIPMAGSCEHLRACCGIEAVHVCRKIGMPHYFVEVRQAFEALIIEPFRRAYHDGRTPSPCIDCNTLLKFGNVWDLLESELGIRHVATGHYARVEGTGDSARLVRGEDRVRDQSYFLYGIPRHRLPCLHLPLGELSKPEVRRIAEEAALPTAARTDSMDLCFAAEGDYRDAFDAGAAQPGPILDTAGVKIGEHQGVHNFTLGQRRGLRVPAKHPLYVLKIVPKDNAVIIGPREEAFENEVRAESVNILQPELTRTGQRLHCKIRSGGEPQDCTITDMTANCITVALDEPVFAPAPGQHLVLYTKDHAVVCGGVIADRREQP